MNKKISALTELTFQWEKVHSEQIHECHGENQSMGSECSGWGL